MPFLDVTFQITGPIFFKYSIMVDGIGEIKRSFSIDTTKKLEKGQKVTGFQSATADKMASGIIVNVQPISPDDTLITR